MPRTVVDGKGHLIGRLAAAIAKEILSGQKIVVVRCEELNISGALYRNHVKFQYFLNRRNNTNPKRGPFHYRAPSRILYRTVRGMIPHKTVRGMTALERLKVYDGVPHPFDRMKRQVVPGALRTLRLKPGRKYCRLGDLASMIGWKHDGLIQKLETKRKTRNVAFYTTKKELSNLRTTAAANKRADLAPIVEELAKLGYA